jgi:hypothetical protein
MKTNPAEKGTQPMPNKEATTDTPPVNCNGVAGAPHATAIINHQGPGLVEVRCIVCGVVICQYEREY